MLTEKSTGKSGSFFFYTDDHKYLLKSIRRSEFKVLLKKLKQYYEYILENPESLLPRYYGLHRINCYKNKKKVVS